MSQVIEWAKNDKLTSITLILVLLLGGAGFYLSSVAGTDPNDTGMVIGSSDGDFNLDAASRVNYTVELPQQNIHTFSFSSDEAIHYNITVVRDDQTVFLGDDIDNSFSRWIDYYGNLTIIFENPTEQAVSISWQVKTYDQQTQSEMLNFSRGLALYTVAALLVVIYVVYLIMSRLLQSI